MISSKEIRGVRNGEGEELKIDTHQLEMVENDGVNLQFVNSNDFMVGKQTNFNGPVTIINYAEGNEPPEKFGEEKFGKEEVVIKEKIIAPSITATMEDFVKKKVQNEFSLFQASDEKKKELSRYGYCWKTFYKIPVFAWSLLLFLVVAGIVTLAVELAFTAESDETENNSFITINGKMYEFVTRKDWNARPPNHIVEIKLPVPYVVIAHSVSRECYTRPECSNIVLNMQSANMVERNFSDIKYNFLVGGGGRIYEGRGWNVRNENGGVVNNRNIDIAFIGDFTKSNPTRNQLDTVKALIEYARGRNYISEDYRLIPASIINNSLSPGKYVIQHIEEDTNPEGGETIAGETRNYTIFSRRDWGASPEVSSVSIRHPVPYVIISSSENNNCTSFQDCKALLLKIQEEQTKATRSDINANFLVSSDGGIFEGRGWDKRSPVSGFANNRNVEINLIGEFTVREHPTDPQLGALKALIVYGVEHGMISDSYTLIPANATGIILDRIEPKLGKNLYEKIKHWPNFEPDPFSRLFSLG